MVVTLRNMTSVNSLGDLNGILVKYANFKVILKVIDG